MKNIFKIIDYRWECWGPQVHEYEHGRLHCCLDQTYSQYPGVGPDDVDPLSVHGHQGVSGVTQVLWPADGDDQERRGEAGDGREEGGDHGEGGLADHEVTQQTWGASGVRG